MTTKKEKEEYWKFTHKKTGYVFISRHKRSDFVAHMTEEEIDKEYIREKVYE